ncbi:uncharacterized protein LOC112466554 [Temnothorax curvispinosus]|uniref:Uncharacterized protein LOC112466554 n=1 Tax=Temnothorax curvispinosus TaxID=300111 RepID=A0A6J1RCH3_9HYME|nr:uncharacterized protein LOC112466554 [Temnothorax curvispinosus]XP_024890479.1 uncharacterized protein LOC112466554 [Temnothorax curvispinosus]XP_024890480.1 uncharacterized protein LOC112466554 [Temnothorax curvispinosus]
MRVTACHFRRCVIAGLSVALLFCVIQVIRIELGFNESDMSNLNKLMYISQLIKESEQSYVRDGIVACKLPQLNISSPEIMKFIHDVPPLSCGPEDWVIVEGSRLVITNKAKTKHGQIRCIFSEIIRTDDYDTKLLDGIEADDFYILRESDFADVRCKSKSGDVWHSILAGVKYDPYIKQKHNWENVPDTGLKLNVLMFGFDSLSRNTFVRKLPKTYRFIKQLNALVLEGYNIVGDGTPQALIPILTGKIELELPETRKRIHNANYVNVYPMIWNKYEEHGYITSFMEDVPHIGTFTYRLKGFDKQPTHHYMRTYYLAASPYFKTYNKFCIAGTPRHMVMMNYIKTIFNTYKNQPKFAFGFHGELSHDSYNDIGAVDDDLYSWVKDLYDLGHLNNTILILMSDHGHRFADIRNTLQGKQEERLPFFSFIFPPWFKQAHPQAYANFVYNTQYLTSPFDIHKTLENILDFDTPKDGDRRQRAISLFDKVPLDRTCADAFIEPHWCACLGWKEVSIDDTNVVAAANYFVQFLNGYTEDHHDICAILHLDEILWAAKLIPTKGLLNFRKSGDQDGFIGDFSAKTKVMTEIYQLKVRTVPGDALFEVSIIQDLVKNTFHTKISDVSRINMYGSQARCVENSLFHLRKYCYCKE